MMSSGAVHVGELGIRKSMPRSRRSSISIAATVISRRTVAGTRSSSRDDVEHRVDRLGRRAHDERVRGNVGDHLERAARAGRRAARGASPRTRPRRIAQRVELLGELLRVGIAQLEHVDAAGAARRAVEAVDERAHVLGLARAHAQQQRVEALVARDVRHVALAHDLEHLVGHRLGAARSASARSAARRVSIWSSASIAVRSVRSSDDGPGQDQAVGGRERGRGRVRAEVGREHGHEVDRVHGLEAQQRRDGRVAVREPPVGRPRARRAVDRDDLARAAGRGHRRVAAQQQQAVDQRERFAAARLRRALDRDRCRAPPANRRTRAVRPWRARGRSSPA